MYSLVSAPVLGFDLTRLGGGSATAEVMLRALRGLLHPSIPPEDVVGDTVWGVLEKPVRSIGPR